MTPAETARFWTAAGADRERKRIRRAQARFIETIRIVRKSLPVGDERMALLTATAALDHSTKRNRGRK